MHRYFPGSMESATEVDHDLVALPSRASALSACHQALSRGGPILLTGAAGVGKTWLLHRLVEESPLRWARLEIATDTRPIDLIAAIAAALGAAIRGESASAIRAAMIECLTVSASDGRPVGLVIDEAHLATDDVLEEFRLLSNRLPRPLAGLILSGQTSLRHRIDRPEHLGLESRLAARVHLLPLDAEEARCLVTTLLPQLEVDRDHFERCHRDSEGVPGRLLRLAGRPTTANPPLGAAMASVDPSAPGVNRSMPPPATISVGSSESLLPTKPPLRVEEGLIEVGWDSAGEEGEATTTAVEEDPDDHQPIDDHYAALQAWDEWARNQGRGTPRHEPDSAGEDSLDDPEIESGPPMARWAEAGQSFGPYSQLFSRVRRLEEAE